MDHFIDGQVHIVQHMNHDHPFGAEDQTDLFLYPGWAPVGPSFRWWDWGVRRSMVSSEEVLGGLAYVNTHLFRWLEGSAAWACRPGNCLTRVPHWGSKLARKLRRHERKLRRSGAHGRGSCEAKQGSKKRSGTHFKWVAVCPADIQERIWLSISG